MNDARVEKLKALLPQTMTQDWVRLGSRLVRVLRDRLHADQHDALVDRLLTQARQSAELRELRRLHVPPVSYPPDLPITTRKDEIVAAIRANQVVVIAGETGSGKTTQIPKMCLEAGLGIEAKVGCTQPRRVAALSISQRIAEELNVRWGREVGCKIRFDDHSSSETYLKLMTDGILLAETQSDPLLSDYNALIIDEAHERSLNIDFLLGYLKGLLARRPDLKLVVTSATIDTQAFSRHFGGAPIIEVSGRMFPVELIYAPFDHEADSADWDARGEEGQAAGVPEGGADDARPHPGPLPRGEGEGNNAPRLHSSRVPTQSGIGRSSSVSFVGEQDASALPPLPGGEGRADGGLLPRSVISSESLQLSASIRASLRAGSGELTYVDAAVRAAETILYESSFGDVLIFMPGERDIREVSDQLEGRFGREAEIVPLYGRLSAGDQQRVFASSTHRKLVIATNIAETSLTIPGIRYVVDAGLARISRYAPRTRTKRLPVEPISQSSANQRKGRAGRMQDGVCVRLYSEEDCKARPPFTQPEIQRANLAEVILRMKAFRLGDIETFAFVQPPGPAAIQAGYGLLQELGALDEQRELTPLGRDLARLPIDPTLGRMLLQAQQEHATRELLIIAAGLGIQDPRERPLDQREAADAAHRRFVHPQSDFLTLLNVWNAVHDQWEALRTQGARRKFCKQHFLSYLRMREWQDLHAQLEGALENLGVFQDEDGRGSTRAAGKAPRTEEQFYRAIHRSILAGLLGHVSAREERNQYRAGGNRLAMIFPGSALFERGERPPKNRFAKPEKNPAPKPKSNQPQWLVAGELVETTQLFARTVAGIDPHWIVQLAPHLCQVSHRHPHWSASAGRVLVDEITRFQGLEVFRRKVAYGNLNPDDATAIFIRSALVEEDLEPPLRSRGGDEAEDETRNLEPARRGTGVGQAASLPGPVVDSDDRVATSGAAGTLAACPAFLAHNRRIREKVESWQTRLRRPDLGDLDEALCKFYAGKLRHVSSRDELLRWLREPGRAASLCAAEDDLSGGRDLALDPQSFPDALEVGGQAVPLAYAYAPGEEHDGVTIRLPVTMADAVSPALLEWSVPGLRAAMMKELLRSLPKSVRRELLPIEPKVQEIVREFRPSRGSFHDALGRFLRDRYQVTVPPDAWRTEGVPAHLRPRIELIGSGPNPVVAGRDFGALQQQLAQVKVIPPTESTAWKQAARQWQRDGLTTFSCGDLPEKVAAGEQHGLPVFGFPGLSLDASGVGVRLFPSSVAARRASLPAWQRLVELDLQKDFAWLERDLRALTRFDALAAAVGGGAELQETALTNLKRHVLPAELPSRLTTANFDEAAIASKRLLPGLASQLIERVGQILQFRQQAAQRAGVGASPTLAKPAAPLKSLHQLNSLGALLGPAAAVVKPAASTATGGFAAEVDALVPRRFLEEVPFAQLPHLPRFLKALMLRIERAANNPPKEAERVKLVAPYVGEARRLRTTPPATPDARQLAEEFRWLVEEYKVSVFAQELGTTRPASPRRLDELLERLRAAG
jgi:ATP-dependent helicase HrpA